ncbi:hypothetical protein [Mycobacterium attenuatum]|uniref:hypothetical protein n=1 Tax=Mycobacterium attenuatum TaxID=2341086 RepID=UPI0010A95BA4|nr:hypothetical protein [Mycobacterium attenuatum]
MTLDGLVSEAGEALGRARSLFGPAAFGVGFASTPALQGAGEQVGSGVGESAGSWQGGAGSGYRRRAGGTVRAVDSTIGADAGAGGGVVAGGDHATSGRAGANGVVQDARNGVAAIAPATGTRAGRDELVAHLQTQLARMRARLRAAEAQDLMLAQQIRAAGGGYGGAGMRGGAPALPGFGGGQAGSAGLGNTPGLSSLTNLASLYRRRSRRTRGSNEQAPRGTVGTPLGQLTMDSTPDQVAAAIVHEAQRRGYSPAQTIAILADGLQESGLRPRAVSPNRLWENVFQQDASYPGRGDPNTAISEFFNRLQTHGGPSSPDIWKSIFWLQQRPGESSADAAFAHGRQAYMSEIQSQVGRATQLYRGIANL